MEILVCDLYFVQLCGPTSSQELRYTNFGSLIRAVHWKSFFHRG